MQNFDETISWYAARTRFGQELGIKSRLDAMGIDNFIPTCRRKDCRGRVKERALINNLVFIRTTKKQACDLKVYYMLPVNYLIDYARHSMLVVPDKQMDDFQRVVNCSPSDSIVEAGPFMPGQKVKVTEGPLTGVEGVVQEILGSSYLTVGLCDCVCAKIKVPRKSLSVVEGE